MSGRRIDLRFSVLALLGLSLVAGCGSGATSAAPDNLAGAFVTCATDTRAMPYQAGMSVTSESGVFTIKLLSSLPGPPIKGQNNWMIEVDQTAVGTPLDGLDVTVAPFMPDHQHPSTRQVVVTPAGAGNYDLNPVYLYMSGLWEVRMTIVSPTLAGGTTDVATIPICIP